jgi:DNA (cytosine-5)-methyltransferase 1
LIHLDLFSGMGGFSLGLQKVFNIEKTYYSEIDKYAKQVYNYNFKNSEYVGSVKDVRGQDLSKVDIITFGSPCQDFSLAGKRKGMEGDRSSLITEAIRLITECRPRFFIWENVKGTFSSNNSEDFWAIIQTFANIGGYRLEWQLLNTKWFLPQNRERIYLVGYIGEGSRGQIFPIRESNKKVNELQRQQTNTCCLTTRYGADGNGSYIIERELDAQIKVKSATSKGFETATPGDSINYSNPNSETRRGRVGKGVAQTLDTACNQAVIGDYRYDEGYRERKDGDAPTLCLRSGDTTIVNKIRRLTPIECERLQGFPDNWSKYGDDGEISDTQRYKMCGNAVTVDVVEAVAKQIKNLYE